MSVTITRDTKHGFIVESSEHPGLSQFCESYELALQSAGALLLDPGGDKLRERISLELEFKRQWLCALMGIEPSSTWHDIGKQYRDLVDRLDLITDIFHAENLKEEPEK